MSEYIDREAAKIAVVEAMGKKHSPFNAIVMLPAADVAPVRHGRWIPCKPQNPILEGFECSECGAQFQGVRPDRYCGHCGARMEGSQT